MGDEGDRSAPSHENQRPPPVQRKPGHDPLPHTAIVRPLDEAARTRRQAGTAAREFPLPSGTGGATARLLFSPTSVGRGISAFPLRSRFLRQKSVKGRYHLRALSDSRRNAFCRSAAYVPNCEDTGTARLKKVSVSTDVCTGTHKAVVIQLDVAL